MSTDDPLGAGLNPLTTSPIKLPPEGAAVAQFNAMTRRLAIDGGAPLFDQPRHVGGPNIVNRAGFQRRLDELLDRQWLTNSGPLVEEFEAAVASIAGVDHCVAMANGTIGLEIASRAIGMAGEVIVPSWTFVATAHALQWQEIRPVFADVDPRTHTLDPRSVESMITPKTTGVIGVHLFGRPCEADELREICDRHGLHLLYDAAHAFGNSHLGRPVGSLGDAEVFSFHATKFLNTFEGGAIVTDDDDLAQQIRWMTNFGFTGRDQVEHLGTNGKMTEVAAAMGLAQLEVMHQTVEANRARFEAYAAGLEPLPGIRLLQPPRGDASNFQYVIIEVDPLHAGISRGELLAVLEAEQVLARRYFFPGCHRMEPYRSHQPHAGLLLPETERIAETVLALPTGTSMSIEDVTAVTALVARAIIRGRSPAAARAGLAAASTP